MKILIITGDSNTLLYHRAELLKRFASNSLEVVAAAPGDHESVRSFLRNLGGRFEPLNLARAGMNIVQDAKSLLEIHRLIRRENPDIVFSYAIKPVIYGSIAAKLNRVRKIFALVPGLGYAFAPDGTWKQRIVGFLAKISYSIALRCVDKVFLQNFDDERLFRDRGILPNRIPTHVTAGSGVDIENFPVRPLFSPAKLENSKFRFLLISRLLKKKGIHEFAEAARLIQRRYPHARFDLVGPFDPSPDGVPPSEVEAWQNEGILNYHGPTRNVQQFLRKAHCFVLPTYYREGIPRSILEALSTGLPIITTDAVGSRETIEITPHSWNQRTGPAVLHCGKNGILVPPRDVKSIVEAMALLLEDPHRALEMGQQSRRLAEARFNVHNVNSSILREMGLPVHAPVQPENLKEAA